MASSPFSLSAEYLGWKPTDGLCGRQFVQQVVRDVMARRDRQRYQLKRHVLEFDKRKLRIFEMDPRTGLKTGSRYPSVPVEDITFALQEDGDSDPMVFSLILFGFNEESKKYIHTHAWRGFNLEAVAGFTGRLIRCLTSPAHLQSVRQLEQRLVREGVARPSGYFDAPPGPGEGGEFAGGSRGSRSSAGGGGGDGGRVGSIGGSSRDGSRPSSLLHSPAAANAYAPPPPAPLPPPPPPPPPPNQSPQVAGAQVTEELKRKLRDNTGAPLLHPPRDYDTLNRSHGNVMLRRTEPLRLDSKAPTGAYIRRSDIRESFNSEAATANGDNLDQGGVDDEDPPPDYDSEEDDGGASTGTMDSASRLEASFISSSGRSSISDHSADPSRGFSTWRRHRAQQPLRQTLPGWQPPPPPPPPQQSAEQFRRPPNNRQS